MEAGFEEEIVVDWDGCSEVDIIVWVELEVWGGEVDESETKVEGDIVGNTEDDGEVDDVCGKVGGSEVEVKFNIDWEDKVEVDSKV